MSQFVHLHVHTQYSLLDGMNTSAKLFERVKELGMSSVAITDHGVLYGVPEFWKMSKDFGVKPIIGCEVYLAPGDMTLRREVNGIRYYHLLLLAKNQEGYINLVKLVTKSHLDGMYYKPRIDLKVLKQYSKGLICTSACLAGPISRHIIRDEYEQAEKWLTQLHGIFKDDFYLEIQRNGITCGDEIDADKLAKVPQTEHDYHLNTITSQIKVNKKLYEYSDKYKIPIIASTDAHYLNDEDREVQKILFCIRDGRTLDDPNGLNGYLDTYIQTPEELLKMYEDMPEVLEETLKIDEKIEPISLKPDRVQPRFWKLKKDESAREELARQTFLGAYNKFKTEELKGNALLLKPNDFKKVLPEDITKQLEYELMVIDKMGYNDYFLVVGDLMQFARKKEIVVGVRGSAAGCLVSYCLEITNVNPMKWGLVFERFLNLERASPPDIDMDIQDDRREELINYAREKYGEDSVAGIITFGRMATKAAIRDVARVMDIDLATADKLSKKVIVLFGKPYSFEKMMKEDSEFKEMVDSDPQLQKLGEAVSKIEGLNRHTGVHAAGYLITPGPIDNYMAYQKDTKDPNLLVTQMDGNWVDKLDYMKFDFLGLRTLTILKNAIIYIEKRHGVKIDLSKVNVDPDEPEEAYDKNAFEVFRSGNTIGVFQFESPPMQKYLIDLKPRTLGDICFMAAAYRPGPMAYIPDYIAIRNGKKEAEYTIPEEEPILRATLGFPVYQEQLLQICQKLGGFTLGDGDVIRNALKKKQLHILQAKEKDFKKYFLENFDYKQETADTIWKKLEPFASYGFNKAHASSYAAVAYWCAYIKGNYPLEFMTALMHSDLENSDRIVVDIHECKRLGFEILPPDINKSSVDFNPEGKHGIRFGLGAIKNVGTKVCTLIVKEREEHGVFQNFDDLIQRVGPKKISKKVSECLIKVGALDKFGDRNGLLEILSQVYEKASKDQSAKERGQEGLFNMLAEHDAIHSIDETKIPSTVQETTQKQRLEWEKELIGIYVTSHPLDQFKWVNIFPQYIVSNEIETLSSQTEISILGMISDKRIVFTKKNNEKMAIMQIQDLYGNIGAVAFPKTFQELDAKELLQEGRPFIISGKVNIRDGTRSIIINEIKPAAELIKPKTIKVDISKIKEKEELETIKEMFTENGDTKVKVQYGKATMDKNKNIVKKYFTTTINIDLEATSSNLRKYIKM